MFSVGDCIVHPMHGAGIIERIEEKKVNGVVREYYILKMPIGDMLVMIPRDTSDKIGVRPIVDFEQAEKILNALGDLKVDMTSNWNRRYRENMMRIKSGDLLEVGKVIKCLMIRESEKGLSTGERKMLRSAKQILISEIVLAESVTYEEVEDRINNLTIA